MILNKFEKIIQFIMNIFLVIASIAMIFSITGFFQLKVLNKTYVNLFGYTVFSVATGSMQPTLNINDIIIIKITDDVKENDIITFRENNEFITHRVIKNNNETFITKGDSNNTEDNPINKQNIIGKFVCKIPVIGILGDILTTPKVFISLMATLLFFSIAYSYVPKEKTDEGVQIPNDSKENKEYYIGNLAKYNSYQTYMKKLSKKYNKVVGRPKRLFVNKKYFLVMKSFKEKNIYADVPVDTSIKILNKNYK